MQIPKVTPAERDDQGNSPGAEVKHYAGSSLASLHERAIGLIASVGTLARRTLIESWEAGRVLEEIARRMRGSYGGWLRDAGIAETTQRRLRSLYARYPQNRQLGGFGSVDAALKAGRDRAKEADKIMPRAKKLTPLQKAKEARDAAERAAEDAERRAAEAERTAKEKTEQVTHLTEEVKMLDPDNTFARGVDVLEARQETIRQRDRTIQRLEEDNADLLRENRGLRRLLKQTQQELARVKRRWAEAG